jgi:hypothetical protein
MQVVRVVPVTHRTGPQFCYRLGNGPPRKKLGPNGSLSCRPPVRTAPDCFSSFLSRLQTEAAAPPRERLAADTRIGMSGQRLRARSAPCRLLKPPIPLVYRLLRRRSKSTCRTPGRRDAERWDARTPWTCGGTWSWAAPRARGPNHPLQQRISSCSVLQVKNLARAMQRTAQHTNQTKLGRVARLAALARLTASKQA